MKLSKDSEEYAELLKKLKTVKPGKECRALHKELRKYGDGIFFHDRYPKAGTILPLIISLSSLFLSVMALIMRLLK